MYLVSKGMSSYAREAEWQDLETTLGRWPQIAAEVLPCGLLQIAIGSRN
jgi:hypothetical protein